MRHQGRKPMDGWRSDHHSGFTQAFLSTNANSWAEHSSPRSLGFLIALDDIIWPRLTESVKAPTLGAEPVFDEENGLWWQGARWFANGVLDVDSRQTVALMVRRPQRKNQVVTKGSTVFLRR